jgi:hypothetical protein
VREILRGGLAEASVNWRQASSVVTNTVEMFADMTSPTVSSVVTDRNSSFLISVGVVLFVEFDPTHRTFRSYQITSTP